MKIKSNGKFQRHTHSVIATFKTRSQAEDAMKQLQHTGFDMKLLSIVGKGYHTEENVEVERAKILLGEFGADDTELFLADEPFASVA